MTTKTLEKCATATPCESLATVAAHVDIYETDDAFTLMANLPGVEEKDINLRVEEDNLRIEATARNTGNPAIRRAHDGPRFSRAFTLGKQVDRDKIQADLKHGVLTVTLPKVAAAQAKLIEVQSPA